MRVHLIDGTYELFRSHFGAPPRKTPDGRQVGATLGLLRSLLALLNTPGVTHVGCAFDHVIESFRNGLYPGYKTSEGVDPELLAQFPLAEEAVSALGLVVWPMVEFEADDALATAAARFMSEREVEQILICSPDKDLAQSVTGSRIVCWDRRRDIVYDEDGVMQKFGVRPQSIPDWLALVGDSADGYPGVPGWGAKTASAVLSRYGHLESIPEDPLQWGLPQARAQRLAESLRSHQQDVHLFRRLATLRTDVPLQEHLPDLEWKGAQQRLKALCLEWGDAELPARITRWQDTMRADSAHPASPREGKRMENSTQTVLDRLRSPDGNERSEALNEILRITDEPVDWAYRVWEGLLADLQHENGHQRAIAAQVLCNLAKSDPESRILRDFDALVAVTRDEKFVTARHCLQSLWKVGVAGKKQQKMVVDRLAGRFKDCAEEKNCTLIRYDIIVDFKKLYDAVHDEKIREKALALIETEEDDKYRKKYAAVWERA